MADVTNKAIEKLCTDLNLAPPDEYTQFWEHEVIIDESRLAEFILYYQEQKLDDDTKFTLMCLIIEIFEATCWEMDEDRDLWSIIENILLKEQDIHAETIRYWSALSDGYDESFYVSLYMRLVLQKVSRENLYRVCIMDIGYEVSISDYWRKLLFSADYDEKFLIDGKHTKGIIAYEMIEVMKFNLRFYVSKILECPEAFDDGLTIFKFESTEFPDIVFYSGNILVFDEHNHLNKDDE